MIGGVEGFWDGKGRMEIAEGLYSDPNTTRVREV